MPLRCGVFIFIVLFFNYSVASLLQVGSRCVPTATVQGPCHDCVCSIEGVYHCSRRQCYAVDLTNATLRNSDLKDLPEIRDGDRCEEGKMYKMDCNTCTCKHNALLCSKMACIDLSQFKEALRQNRKKDKKEIKRSKDATAKKLAVSDREFLMLPQLPHHAADCTPTKKYKVDCNVCICNKHKNLVCDNEMCVDQKTTRHIEAKKNSGKTCSKNFETKKCIKCKCKRGTTNCEPIADCQTEEDKLMLSKGAGSMNRLTFNYKDEECFPDVVYKEKCNKCYCQPDKTLRCTNKMCLNHQQALQLEEQREYLEEHGL